MKKEISITAIDKHLDDIFHGEERAAKGKAGLREVIKVLRSQYKTPKELRAAFIARAVSRGYSKEYAGIVAGSVGIKVNSPGGGRPAASLLTRYKKAIAKVKLRKGDSLSEKDVEALMSFIAKRK